MAELQIQAKTQHNLLHLSITYPSNPEMSYNFTLTLTVLEQVVANRSEVTAYRKIFHTQQRQIQITDLKYSTMYKVVVVNKFGKDSTAVERTKNIFVFTQARREQQQQENAQESSSIEYVARQQHRPSSASQARPRNPNAKKPQSRLKHSNAELCNSELLVKTLAQSNHIVNKNKAHQYMLESRKCRNTAEFINQKNGRLVNPSEVSDKRMLVIQSKLLFAEIYKYRDGCRFFQNNWCMGPFYSYDRNEGELRKQ